MPSPCFHSHNTLLSIPLYESSPSPHRASMRKRGCGDERGLLSVTDAMKKSSLPEYKKQTNRALTFRGSARVCPFIRIDIKLPDPANGFLQKICGAYSPLKYFRKFSPATPAIVLSGYPRWRSSSSSAGICAGVVSPSGATSMPSKSEPKPTLPSPPSWQM